MSCCVVARPVDPKATQLLACWWRDVTSNAGRGTWRCVAPCARRGRTEFRSHTSEDSPCWYEKFVAQQHIFESAFWISEVDARYRLCRVSNVICERRSIESKGREWIIMDDFSENLSRQVGLPTQCSQNFGSKTRFLWRKKWCKMFRSVFNNFERSLLSVWIQIFYLEICFDHHSGLSATWWILRVNVVTWLEWIDLQASHYKAGSWGVFDCTANFRSSFHPPETDWTIKSEPLLFAVEICGLFHKICSIALQKITSKNLDVAVIRTI